MTERITNLIEIAAQRIQDQKELFGDDFFDIAEMTVISNNLAGIIFGYLTLSEQEKFKLINRGFMKYAGIDNDTIENTMADYYLKKKL